MFSYIIIYINKRSFHPLHSAISSENTIELLLFLSELQTAGHMIMKGGITLHLLLADCATVDAVLQGEGLAKMFLAMLPHIMNDSIRLRHSLEFTTGTLELLTLLCRMACGHMNC
jgi:hypothetical protein